MPHVGGTLSSGGGGTPIGGDGGDRPLGDRRFGELRNGANVKLLRLTVCFVRTQFSIVIEISIEI